MTFFGRYRFRGSMAVALAALIAGIGVRAANAASPAPDPVPAGPTAEIPAAQPDQGPAAAETPAAETPSAAAPAAVPQLQVQDEGPSGRNLDRSVVSRAASPIADERPFWRSWIFWTVTGALVVGAVALVAHTASQTNSSLAACPPTVQVSLGCFGAGRGQ